MKKDGYDVERWSCDCCRQCWLIVSGQRAGTCIYSGPYDGYERDDDAPKHAADSLSAYLSGLVST